MENVSNIYELECGYDLVRWIKFIESKNKKPSNSEIISYQDEIIKLNDSAFAYFFACEYPIYQYKMQKIILNNQDYLYTYLFAKNVKGADIKALEKKILLSNKIRFICKFLCYIETCSKHKLEELLFQSQNHKYIYYYLKHGKNQNIEKIHEILINSKKPRYLYEISKHIDDLFDLEKIETSLLNSYNFNYIILFAQHNKFANIERIEEFIIDNGSNKDIRKFAKYIKNSKLNPFAIL